MQESHLHIPYSRDNSQHQYFTEAQNFIQDEPHMDHLLMGIKTQRRKIQETKKKDLKKVIADHKKKAQIKNFVGKLKLNSLQRKPIEFEDVGECQQQRNCRNRFKKCVKVIGQMKGIKIGNVALVLWSFTNIIQITCMVFIFSIMMAFPETTNFNIFLHFRIFSVILYVIDMILNFSVQRYENGKLLDSIGEISDFYLHNGFKIDIISILIFPIDLMIDSSIATIISFVAIIKLANNLKKFEKFQYLAITNSEKEQYYGLIKVFVTNFVIGHFLSTFLNLMVMMNSSDNWHIKLGIQDSQWYIKYIWGYYWGTNIMLTVGFGDIAATNHYEAIVLIFIQTFSCITLAYNISYVGALISQIRKDNEIKKKKLKTFHQMCQQNQIQNELESKVCNFIEEEYRIKEQFQYDDHDQVLESLPKSIQREYRIQANKILFDGLGFLTNLSKKSLLNLAEMVSRKICHPQEIMFRRGTISDFIILQKGHIGFACRINSQLDGKVIQKFEVDEKKKPMILSLDFIKNKVFDYNVKSMSYSVLYYLTRQNFMESIQSSQLDYQMFCVMKDRTDYVLGQNNLYACQHCPGEYHNKFECGRLHYTPIKQIQILKYIHRVNNAKQKGRNDFKRNKNQVFPLFQAQYLKEEQKKFIEDNYDEQYYKEIEKLFQFYSKIQHKKQKKQTILDEFQQKIMKTPTHNPIKRKNTMLFALSGNDQHQLRKFQEFLQANSPKVHTFWDLQIDLAHNFKYYFINSNPDKLSVSNLKKGKADRIRNPYEN